MNPWLDRRVLSFAHQGGSFEGPSSTLWAIEHALSLGVSAIELDVHATRDRHLVVCHDESVDRTTNHRGAIAQLTLAQLREMDNAYWWIEGDVVSPGRDDVEYLLRGRAPGNSRYGIATLEDVVRAFPGVLLNLDIKATFPEVEAYEELLFEELRRLDIVEQVIVASFHDDAIQRFRKVAPGVATSAATNETAAFFFSLDHSSPQLPNVSALQVPPKYGNYDVVSEAFVESAHRLGVAVHVWTINDESEMARLIDLGVDGLMSDRPSILVRLLEERKVNFPTGS